MMLADVDQDTVRALTEQFKGILRRLRAGADTMEAVTLSPNESMLVYRIFVDAAGVQVE